MSAARAQRFLSSGAVVNRLRRPFMARIGFSSSAGSSRSTKDPIISKIQLNLSQFPPPYDSWSYMPPPLDYPRPADPTDLHRVFLHLRSPQGLCSFFERMLDALVADGLAYEAQIFNSRMMVSGKMANFVVPTAVISAYAGAGKMQEAIKTFEEMVEKGIRPNAYTYTLLIQGLARGGMVEEAGKYLVKLVEARRFPNNATIQAVFEAFVKKGMLDEAREVLEDMKVIGFALPPIKKTVMKGLDRTSPFYEPVVDLLFPKE